MQAATGVGFAATRQANSAARLINRTTRREANRCVIIEGTLLLIFDLLFFVVMKLSALAI